MTTVLYFQNLAQVMVEDCPFWPRRAWQFANSLTIPKEVSGEQWAQTYDDFYGYSRREDWY